jgi:hypothetical protein
MGDRLVHAGDVYQSVVVTGDGNNAANCRAIPSFRRTLASELTR